MKEAKFHFFAGERWRKYIPTILIICAIVAGIAAGYTDFESSYLAGRATAMFLAVERISWFILESLLGYDSIWVNILENMYLCLFCLLYATAFTATAALGYKVYTTIKARVVLSEYTPCSQHSFPEKRTVKQNPQVRCMALFYAILEADKQLKDAFLKHHKFVTELQHEWGYREGQTVYGINGEKLKSFYKQAVRIARNEEILIRMWSGRHISDSALLKPKRYSLYSAALRLEATGTGNNNIQLLNTANTYIAAKTVYSLLAYARYDDKLGILFKDDKIQLADDIERIDFDVDVFAGMRGITPLFHLRSVSPEWERV